MIRRFFVNTIFAAILILICKSSVNAQGLSSLSDELKKISSSITLKRDADKNSSKLQIFLFASARQYFGDWDAMQFENESYLKDGREAPVILSVESLLDPPNFSWSKKVNLLDHRKSQGFEIQLPTSESKSINLFGVFVCRDSKGEGACGKKPFEPIEDILDRYLPDSEGKTKAQPGHLVEDRIYYFSVFLLEGNTVYAYKAAPFIEKHAEVFRKVLSVAYPSNLITEKLRYVEEHLRVIGSVPGEIKRIPLPSSNSNVRLGPYMYWIDLPRLSIGGK